MDTARGQFKDMVNQALRSDMPLRLVCGTDTYISFLRMQSYDNWDKRLYLTSRNRAACSPF
jgi:hypothetical protein